MFKDSFLNTFKKSKILLVIGETGSGKSTKITQILLDANLHKNKIIGCTQPRRLATITVASRVASERNVKLGNQVGYTIRFEDITTNLTSIKYMTEGILIKDCIKNGNLSFYSIIILDEAHERTINIDILMGICKKIISRRDDFNLVITSATLNIHKFSLYFNRCPIFAIPGRKFPVLVFFSNKIIDNYIEANIKTILQIHFTNKNGDILSYLTGMREIEQSCQLIKQKINSLDKYLPKLFIYPIYSTLSVYKQIYIFKKTSKFSRKCIISTNITETSLTVPGISYVIDSGYFKCKYYDHKSLINSLLVIPISKSSAKQRSGRAGRTGPGKCYRLYTHITYEKKFKVSNTPEILRLNLSSIILTLKALGLKNLIEFDFIDKPKSKNFIFALEEVF
jgi:HrpA-like RNA helicase